MVNDFTVLHTISCLCVLPREPGLDTSIHSPGADSHISCCSFSPPPHLGGRCSGLLPSGNVLGFVLPVTASDCCQCRGFMARPALPLCPRRQRSPVLLQNLFLALCSHLLPNTLFISLNDALKAPAAWLPATIQGALGGPGFESSISPIHRPWL